MNIKQNLKHFLKEEESLRNKGLSLADLPEPSLIPNMTRAVRRIIELLKQGKRLLIVGDYDCDGIISTTICISFFAETDYSKQIGYIVPDRFVDGYGVSKNMITYALVNEYDFIVTVDNGIGAAEAVKYGKENGIEIIITDHHTPGNAVPDVDIIVDLKYELGDFPFIEISGATIAWYLCAEVNNQLELGLDMREWIDLVAITVVSDVMPLKDINLIFYYFGMKMIKERHRYIYELIFSEFQNKTLNETDIGFKLVPMINAVGRIDHAKHAIELFLSNSVTEIKKGVEYLISINNKRKVLTEQLLEIVLPEAHRQYLAGEKALIVRHESLHEGIVGILAGKLAERYRRPSYVFGWNGAKQCWKGSGRSSGIVQLFDLTCNGSQHALGFGGHAGAVGVAIPKDNFEKWTNSIMTAAKKINTEEFYATEVAPVEVILSDIDNELMDILDEFRPFGEGFRPPVFRVKATISILESFKEGLHWKCLVTDKMGNSYLTWFFHDKNIKRFDQKEIDINFMPQRAFSNEGLKIELHGTIPFEV